MSVLTGPHRGSMHFTLPITDVPYVQGTITAIHQLDNIGSIEASPGRTTDGFDGVLLVVKADLAHLNGDAFVDAVIELEEQIKDVIEGMNALIDV